MEAAKNTIEQAAHDVLNAGFGLVATVGATTSDVQAKIVGAYNDLVARGAADQSEVAQNVRRGFEQGLDAVKETRGRIEETIQGVVGPKKAVA